MPQSAFAHQPADDLRTAASPARTIDDCIAKLEMVRRLLGMEEPRGPEVELAEDERLISYGINSVLAALKSGKLYVA